MSRPFKRILITGAAGRLGTQLRRGLAPLADTLRLADWVDVPEVKANEEVVVFEVDADPLRQRDLPSAVGLSRFPSVRRDLALVVPEGTAWSELARIARERVGSQLADVILFDQYTGPGLEPGFKSLAMGLILQDVSRTLTEQDVEEKVTAVVRALAEQCQARLRS